MSSSRRKQMKPRLMKPPSPTFVDADNSENFEDDLPLKSAETPTSGASFNDVDETTLSEGEHEENCADDDADVSPKDEPLTASAASVRADDNNANSIDSSPFECHICHRKFKHRRSKSRHVMYHTGQKRHFCRYCNASFYRSDHLKAHTRTHTMPGMLDNGAEATKLNSSRLSQTSPVKRTPNSALSNGNNKRLLFDSSSLHESNSMSEPPLKIAHREEIEQGRHSVSSGEPATNMAFDLRRSITTPINFNIDDSVPLPLVSTQVSEPQTTDSVDTRKCPFCQSPFASAELLRRHLREENCTLHPDTHNQCDNSQFQDKHSQFAIPESPKASTSFSCPLCPSSQQQQFLQPSSLIMHLACEHRFNQDSLLAAVQSQKSEASIEAPAFSCQACDVTTNSLSTLHQHVFSTHVKFIYRCSICNFSSSESETLAKHFISQHCRVSESASASKAEIKHCPICSLSCGSHELYLVHMVTGHSWLRCSQCSEVFASERALSKHCETEHPQRVRPSSTSSNSTKYHSESVIQCLACSRTFRGRIAMKQHLIHFHHFDTQTKSFVFAEEVYYVCEVCPDVFRSASLLAEHTSMAHNVEPVKKTSIKCSFCSDHFMVAIDLEKHMIEKHAEELLKSTSSVVKKSSINCQQCSASFDSQYALEMHTFEEHLMNAVRANGSDDGSSKKSFHCSACDSSSSDLPSFALHRVREHGAGCGDAATTLIKCPSCRVNLTSVSDYLKHTESRHKVNANNGSRCYFTCCLCSEYMRDLAELANHAVRLHFPEALTCVVCDSPLPDLTVARSLRLPGSNDLVYCCSNCHQVDADFRRCNLCNAVFDTIENLKWHNSKYHGSSKKAQPVSKAKVDKPSGFVIPKPVNMQCSLCDTLCKSEESLTIHLIEHSFPDANYHCPICVEQGDAVEAAYFESAQKLDDHVRSNHSSASSLNCVCTECNRTFMWSGELKHHLAQHDLERDEHSSQPVPGTAQTKAIAAALQLAVANLSNNQQTFSCTACQRSFPTVRSLANHQRQCLSKSHLNGDDDGAHDDHGSNPVTVAEPSEFLRCFICKNKFANAQSLQKHARTIHGLESAEFWCSLCDSKLVNYKQLLHHLSSEHDINIAQSVCDLCGDAFTMLKNLKRHLKRVHKVIWQAPNAAPAPVVATSCATQHLAAVNSAAPGSVDSPSIVTSEGYAEDGATAVVDD